MTPTSRSTPAAGVAGRDATTSVRVKNLLQMRFPLTLPCPLAKGHPCYGYLVLNYSLPYISYLIFYRQISRYLSYITTYHMYFSIYYSLHIVGIYLIINREFSHHLSMVVLANIIMVAESFQFSNPDPLFFMASKSFTHLLLNHHCSL